MPKTTLIIIMSIALPLLQCGPSSIAGGVTETTNSAMVFLPSGEPAVGARIVVLPAHADPRAVIPVDTLITDQQGSYRLDNLPKAAYTLLFSLDSLLARRDSVIASGSPNTLRDTLSAAAGIRGVVNLLPGHDPRTVYLLLTSSDRFTTPDDTAGNFHFSNLAPGSYHLRALTTIPGYDVFDTLFTILPGESGRLDTLRLAYHLIAAPGHPGVTADSASQTARLTWVPGDNPAIRGFAVTRRVVGGSAPWRTCAILSPRDSLYIDSSRWSDQSDHLEENDSCLYRIAPIDSTGIIGIATAPQGVRMTSCWARTESYTLPASLRAAGSPLIAASPSGHLYAAGGTEAAIAGVAGSGSTIIAKLGTEVTIADIALPTDSTILVATAQHCIILDTAGNEIRRFPFTARRFALAAEGSDTAYATIADRPGYLPTRLARLHIGNGSSEMIFSEATGVLETVACDSYGPLVLRDDRGTVCIERITRVGESTNRMVSGTADLWFELGARAGTVALMGRQSIQLFKTVPEGFLAATDRVTSPLDAAHISVLSSNELCVIDMNGIIHRLARTRR